MNSQNSFKEKLVHSITAITDERGNPFVRLRGKWLYNHGIREGATIYITETPEGLLLSVIPSIQSPGISLGEIRAKYCKMGIDIESSKQEKRYYVGTRVRFTE
jgi:hypothetical protein